MGLPPKSPASRLRALEGEDPLGMLERLKRGSRLRQTYSLPLSSGLGPVSTRAHIPLHQLKLTNPALKRCMAVWSRLCSTAIL